MLNFKQSTLAAVATIALGCAGTPALAATGNGPSVRADSALHSLGLRTDNGPLVLARRGADDAAGDDRGGRGRGADDGANHARRGADDAAGDDRGGRGRGADDGAGHA